MTGKECENNAAYLSATAPAVNLGVCCRLIVKPWVFRAAFSTERRDDKTGVGGIADGGDNGRHFLSQAHSLVKVLT